MTRIFDAFRKAQAHANPGALKPPPPAAAPPPRMGTVIGRAMGAAQRAEPAEAPSPALRGYPLVAGAALEDDVIQQMTSLRISIESALPEQARRVVMVQSSQRKEGATTVAHQLARALARDERQRVLLVDAHARHPGLEVDSASRTAFAARAAGRAPRAAEAAGAPNLVALPVSEEAHRTGILTAGALRDLIETAAMACDWIVVDGPPVLESPEAAALGALADGVVLVVQAGRTRRPVLARSAELLRKSGARVLGTVLNRRRLEIPGFIYRRI
ncbi:MAG TPA: hypothetical protein VGK89_07275 [Candidatus Eisenbacteria bacterium]|jgi:Mrp family chromosome partitioning ATPase